MRRSAFTLIELMIVIVIMGVVYTLAINNFSRLREGSTKLTLGNLKEYLSSLEYKKSAKVLCFDDCSKCAIYIDGNKSREIDGFLDGGAKSYRYDSSYGFVQKDFAPFFNADGVEESLCFSYGVDSNKIGDQVLIEYKNRFYDMTKYLEQGAVYNSLQDAKDARESAMDAVIK